MKVSVIVPIYNRELYLEMCLDSLVNQNMDEYEVILIDDGSIDLSKEICLRYINRYSFFKYFYHEHQGPGIARNIGIQHAKGKYLMFLDSDDCLEENCLLELHLFADKYKFDIVYFDEYVCDEQLNIQRVSPIFSDMVIEIPKVKALQQSMQPAHLCPRIYHRELFDQQEFLDIWYEDVAIFPLLVQAAQKIGYYKVPLYYYRIHKNSITAQQLDSRNKDIITAWNQVSARLLDNQEERNAVMLAIKHSIVEFMYFRQRFAIDYLIFYNRMFAEVKQQKEIPSHVYGNKIRQELQSDYALLQQASFFGKEDILIFLSNLEALLQTGGTYILQDLQDNDDLTKINSYESLVLGCEDEIFIRAIRVDKHNVALESVLQLIRKQNLISLRGRIKQMNMTRTILQSFVLHNIQIDIV